MKKLLLLISIGWGVSCDVLKAQQETLYSQYMFNLYAYNPAYTGASGKLALNAIYRHQWADFPGAPRTFLANVNGLICPLRSGIGLSLSGDLIGAFAQYNASLQYAFRIPVGNASTLALGISGGLQNISIDPNKIVLANNSDITFQPPQRSITKPDIGAGLCYIAPSFYLGFSAAHILENNFAVFDSVLDSRLQRNFFLTGGYDWRFSNDLTISASGLLRQTSSAPLQMDVNVRALIARFVWAGVGWRPGDSFIIQAGVVTTLRDKHRLRFGYAFDITSSKLGFSNTLGSHEIFLNYSWGSCSPKNKKKPAAPTYERYTKTPENF